MKPDYEKAAEELMQEGQTGVLAAVDATQEADLAKQFDIKGFPTLNYFKDGEFAWKFEGRDKAKIVEFMKE